MRLRLKTWLLIAILAFAANFGVSRVAPPQAPSAIASVLADRADAETAIEVRPSRSAMRVTQMRVSTPGKRRVCSGLDSPLFQRPPPASLS